MNRSMNPTRLLIIPVAACIALAACTGPTDPEVNDITRVRSERGPTGGPAFQTSSDRYAVAIDEEGYPNVEDEIPMAFINPTDETVYMIGCKRPPMPILLKSEGDEWVVAYAAAELACLSPPFTVQPGEVFRDTLHLYAFFRGQSILPDFKTDVDGTYRLVRSIYADPEGDHPLDEELRTSNAFELVSEPK